MPEPDNSPLPTPGDAVPQAAPEQAEWRRVREEPLNPKDNPPPDDGEPADPSRAAWWLE